MAKRKRGQPRTAAQRYTISRRSVLKSGLAWFGRRAATGAVEDAAAAVVVAAWNAARTPALVQHPLSGRAVLTVSARATLSVSATVTRPRPMTI